MQGAIVTSKDSPEVSSSNIELDKTDKPTPGRKCDIVATFSSEQSSDEVSNQRSDVVEPPGENPQNAEINELIPVEHVKRKRGRPRSRHLTSKADSAHIKETSAASVIQNAQQYVSLLTKVDPQIQSSSRPGLRGNTNRKPKVFKDYVVGNTPKILSLSGDKPDGEEPVDEVEMSENEELPEPKQAFQCDECDFQTSSASSLKVHLRKNHNVVLRKHKCPMCFRHFVSDRGLQRHRKLKMCMGTPEVDKTVEGEEQLKCDQCEYKASTVSGLKIHRHKHNKRQGKLFTCNLCSKKFTSVQGVDAHQRLRCLSLHKKNPKVLKVYHCDECGRPCKDKKRLMDHLASHSHIRSHKCDLCPKTYKTMGTLLRHRRKHQDKFHHCSECDFKTRWPTSLKAHFTTVHSVDNRIFLDCPHCPYKTKNKFYLKRHVELHSDDRPFICEICGKASKSEVVLKVHLETHQDSEYPCSKCDYIGKTRMAIYSHRLVHLPREQMNYKCEHCSWVGKRKSELRMHYRKHSSLKLFQCGHCGKSYKHKHALTRHLREKHIIANSEHLSALEELASEAEHDVVLNNVQEIIDGGQINIQVNPQHLEDAQLLHSSQNSALDQESLEAQSSILNGISHIIQSTQVAEDGQPIPFTPIIHNSADMEGSKVVSQIVQRYQIIQDSHVIEQGDVNPEDRVLTHQVIQHPNVTMTSLPVAQFFEITTTDGTGESHIQTAQ